MKKLVVMLLVLCLVLVFTHLAQSGEPRYKALFNLATDARHYQDVEYKSSLKTDYLVLFTVVDKRPEQEKVFNEDVQWFNDDIWTQPPARMLEEIFLRELRWSNMFKSVDTREPNPSLTLEIELSSLLGHYGEGRVAKGTVKIHAMLKSASDGRVIINKKYGQTSTSRVPPLVNAYGPMLRNIGISLENVVKGLLMDLENTLSREKK
jgi:ABC-type uncharacterized transport system auxiliary subunit